MKPNLSEHRVAPSAVIVHDPVRWGALGVFDDDLAKTREQFLFEERPDPDVYSGQVQGFHDRLRGLVKQVLHLDQLVEDAPDSIFAVNPNHIFTRDSAVTLPWAPGHYIACNMARPIRSREPDIMAKALSVLGLKPLMALPSALPLEGGDVIPLCYDGKRGLFVGHGPRTALATIEYLAEQLIPHWLDEIIAILLSPRRINLDGAFCPVDEGLAIVNRESLLEARRYDAAGGRELPLEQAFDEAGLKLIDVSFEDSRARQACNCFCAGDRQVVMYDLCPSVAEAVAAAGLTVTTVSGSELVKGNGGPRCMTRPIYS